MKDQKVEANLRALGIPFEIEHIQVADIDLEEGLRRQTRLLGKLNQDYAVQLATAMSLPEAAFPMTILQKPPRGKLWPWSGNHRLAGFTLAWPDEPVIEAYTLTLKDPVKMDILPRIVNAWESGLGFSKEEKIINARWLVDHHSMPTQEAANMLGIPVKWLQRAKAAEDIRKDLIDLGPKANGIARTVLIQMGPLADNLNVLKAAGKILTTFNIKGKEAEHLLADVKLQRTELQQMSELARWEKILNDRCKPRQKAPIKLSHGVRDQFIRHLTGLAKILTKCKTIEQLQCTDPADKDIVARNWIAITAVMNAMAQRKDGGA